MRTLFAYPLAEMAHFKFPLPVFMVWVRRNRNVIVELQIQLFILFNLELGQSGAVGDGIEIESQPLANNRNV